MNVPTPNSVDGPARHRMLGIYLNDHLAGATTGTALVRRMVQEHHASAYGDDLDKLATEISRDRQALVGLLSDLDVPVRRYKLGAAWLAEKIGRLKPNGRLLRRSGLAVLVELEALRLGAQGKASLWRALLPVSALEPRLDADRVEGLLRRAEQQIRTLDSLHARAVVQAFRLHPRATPRPAA
ncbi:hypothetical protein DI272_11670 [Streptomyces sp. Act143]|uniref:hypothetical protein n=1 Tax=Streptomyces sp. Act143 TaxID=2200760 RepID=UPI000D67F636|nr:hypothetical protein [Streptomyces sp. Act143]PWI14742.1 hypothetical protein DI272_11670 [Streptomyces sp. Act143]